MRATAWHGMGKRDRFDVWNGNGKETGYGYVLATSLMIECTIMFGSGWVVS
jgi:hypothetical protein